MASFTLNIAVKYVSRWLSFLSHVVSASLSHPSPGRVYKFTKSALSHLVDGKTEALQVCLLLLFF